ncbi:methyltransferase domain-containing protein [Aliikangiella sp. IMCC44653]
MNILKLLVSFSLLTLSVVLVGCAEEPKPVPKNKFEEAVFNPERPPKDVELDSQSKPVEMLKLMDLKPGMKVLDIYAGTGYFSELMSYMVGDSGHVYLHNKPKNVEKSTARFVNNRLPNVSPLVGSLTQFKVPEAVDFVLVSKVFHDLFTSDDALQNAQAFFTELDKAVKPGSRVFVVDHSAPNGSGYSQTSKTHRIAAEYVVKVFADNGYQLASRSNLLANPNDSKTLNIWEPSVFKKTDKFILIFEKQ